MVVESVHVQGSAAQEVVARPYSVAAGGHGTGGVELLYQIYHVPGQQYVRVVLGTVVAAQGMDEVEQEVGFLGAQVLYHIVPGVALLDDFVAHAPHHHARVVAVAPDKVLHVAHVPLVEEAGVVVTGLALAPHVHSLVHHQQPHLVAELEEHRGWRVVGSAYGIDTHIFKHAEFALQRPSVYGGAYAAHIVVQAYAEELEVLPVEEKSLVGVPGDAAYAEAGVVAVLELAVGVYFQSQGVQLRMARPPELRVFQAQALRNRVVAGAEAELILAAHEFASGWGKYAAAQLHVVLGEAGYELGFELHRTAFTADFGRGYEGAVVIHCQVGGGHQPDVTVNAAACVPA